MGSIRASVEGSPPVPRSPTSPQPRRTRRCGWRWVRNEEASASRRCGSACRSLRWRSGSSPLRQVVPTGRLGAVDRGWRSRASERADRPSPASMAAGGRTGDAPGGSGAGSSRRRRATGHVAAGAAARSLPARPLGAATDRRSRTAPCAARPAGRPARSRSKRRTPDVSAKMLRLLGQQLGERQLRAPVVGEAAQVRDDEVDVRDIRSPAARPPRPRPSRRRAPAAGAVAPPHRSLG